jgi:hypothetical protein
LFSAIAELDSAATAKAPRMPLRMAFIKSSHEIEHLLL